MHLVHCDLLRYGFGLAICLGVVRRISVSIFCDVTDDAHSDLDDTSTSLSHVIRDDLIPSTCCCNECTRAGTACRLIEFGFRPILRHKNPYRWRHVVEWSSAVTSSLRAQRRYCGRRYIRCRGRSVNQTFCELIGSWLESRTQKFLVHC